MRRSWITPIRLLLGVALLLLGASQLPGSLAGRVSRGAGGMLEKVESTVVGPLRDLSGRVRRGDDVMEEIEIHATRELNFQELLSENERLRQSLDRANQALSEYRQVAVSTQKGVGAVLGSVIKVQRKSGTLIIDRGSKGGIVKGDPVVAGGQLVGKVVIVNGMTATVETIGRSGTFLRVRFFSAPGSEEKRETVATLEVDGGGDFFAVVSKNVDIRRGDIGRLMAVESGWPEMVGGKIIGYVTGVGEDDVYPTLRKRVRVRMKKDLMGLRRVVVLTEDKRGGEGSGEQKGGIK